MTPERITSGKNPLAAHVRKLGASHAYRHATGESVCDGEKLLMEALTWSVEIPALLALEGIGLPPLPERTRVAFVPEGLLQSVSPVDTPQAVLFTCRIRGSEPPETLTGTRYAVLDGVQDPGNVGTILRAADAFGLDGLFLLPGCAEAWGPKCLRASMGAVFRRPVWTCGPSRLRALLTASGLPLYGAALRGDTRDARETDLNRAAVLIGSEGRGISPEMLALCDGTVRLPMEPSCESLNAGVAAAILFWEGYKKRERDKYTDKTDRDR